MKDFLIVAIPSINIIYTDFEDPSDGYGACRIFVYWLVSILVDHIIEHNELVRYIGWNAVDLLILVSAIWSIVVYTEFVLNTKVRLESWDFNPDITLFLVCRGHDLVLPLSILSFFMCIRMLRYLDVFPTVLVPWRTFTRSAFEIFSYMIAFILTLVAFASLYTINFGGQDEDYSGVGRSIRALSPLIFDALPPSDGGAGARIASEVINIFFAFTATFFHIQFIDCDYPGSLQSR